MAQLMEQVIGHGQAKARWRGAVASGRLAHAWLVAGPRGVGKSRLLRAMAQDLLCSKSPGQACGACGDCLRVVARTHESLHEVDTEGATIKIEQVRGVREFLSLALMGHAQVVMVPDADRLTLQAANALLKSLEEPPAGTHFLLSSSAPDGLPSTIRSRVQWLMVGPLAEAELRRVGEFPDWVVAACGGRADLAEVLAASTAEGGGLREMALRPWLAGKGFWASEGDAWSESVRDREVAERTVWVWRQLLRDGWLMQSADPRLIHRDQTSAVKVLSALAEHEREFLWQELNQLEEDIRANVDRPLAFHSFWLRAEEVLR